MKSFCKSVQATNFIFESCTAGFLVKSRMSEKMHRSGKLAFKNLSARRTGMSFETQRENIQKQPNEKYTHCEFWVAFSNFCRCRMLCQQHSQVRTHTFAWVSFQNKSLQVWLFCLNIRILKQERIKNVPWKYPSFRRRHAADSCIIAACGQSSPVKRPSKETLLALSFSSTSFAPSNLLRFCGFYSGKMLIAIGRSPLFFLKRCYDYYAKILKALQQPACPPEQAQVGVRILRPEFKHVWSYSFHVR